MSESQRNKITGEKWASDFEKPDRIHTLFPEEIEVKMWPLPIKRSVYGRKIQCAGIEKTGD